MSIYADIKQSTQLEEDALCRVGGGNARHRRFFDLQPHHPFLSAGPRRQRSHADQVSHRNDQCTALPQFRHHGADVGKLRGQLRAQAHASARHVRRLDNPRAAGLRDESLAAARAANDPGLHNRHDRRGHDPRGVHRTSRRNRLRARTAADGGIPRFLAGTDVRRHNFRSIQPSCHFFRHVGPPPPRGDRRDEVRGGSISSRRSTASP